MAIQQFIQQRTAFWRFLPAVALLLTLALALGLAKPAQAATTTISDQASCEAFGGSVQFSTCEVRADITIAAGDTLVIQFPTEFRQDLINNGTLVVQDRTSTDVPALVNNGTINVEDRLSMIQFRNGGVINITGNMTLLSSTSRNMSAGQIYVRNGGNFTIRTGTGFLINDGAITIECGGVMTYVATGLSGNPPQDICPPDVKVNQAAGQADPTNRNPLLFTATFRQAVTGFSETDVILGGTADRSGATVTVSGGPNSYTISVDGVTGNGTVTAAVPADAATDAEGQGNPASTSSDNSITYLSDFTPPSANPSQSPAANGAGWNNSDVTVDWRWSDVNSLDTAQCTTRSTSSGEGVLTLTATCQDIVGNVGTASYTVKVDKTAPTISAAATALPNSNGWYNGDVTIRFTCADATSGLAPTACPADQILSSEGNAVASTARTVTDLAGNTSAASNVVTVKIDKTAPTISAATTGAPNANGWYNSNVTVQFTCNDNLSGVASCPADELLSSEGAAVASTAQTITDLAGNSSAASNVVTVQLDKTAPVVTVTGVSNGANYTLGSVPTAACSTSDALSGVATQATVAVTGGNADGTGNFTATCSDATDNAGNNGSASVSYTVSALVDACTTTALRDNFNRASGSLGSNWAGTTNQSFYKIAGNQVDVQLGGPVVWKPTTFGVNQAAFVTLSTLDAASPSQGLLLKVQGSTIPNAGAIAVVYDNLAKVVRVSTLRLNTPAWTVYPHVPVTFANGDKLGGCVQADGTVRVYQNNSLLTTVTLNAADQSFFNAKGGKIGLWTVAAPNAFFDDFGGGALTGVSSAMLDTPVPGELADDGTEITVAVDFPTDAAAPATPDAGALVNRAFLPLVNR